MLCYWLSDMTIPDEFASADDDENHDEGDPQPADSSSEPSQPMHAQFRHNPVAARVPERIGSGQFANGAIVQSGPYEFIIDFTQRLSKPFLVAERIVLPVPVVGQFVAALQQNLEHYEKTYGQLPEPPMPRESSAPTNQPAPEQGTDPVSSGVMQGDTASLGAGAGSGSMPSKPHANRPANIEEIYENLKLRDEQHVGVYAHAVLLRHSNTEFCFDFITNFYPRSVVNSRVIMPAPQVTPFFRSLRVSYQQRTGK